MNRDPSSRSRLKSTGYIPPDLDPTPILLSPGLEPGVVRQLLTPYGIRHPDKADANLQAMAGEPRARILLAGLLRDLLTFLAQTADPDQALNEWERYVNSGIHRIQLFSYLTQSPKLLQLLCTIFGNSPAMAQTLHRDPLLIYWLGEEEVLARRMPRARLDTALTATLTSLTTPELKLEALRRFNRRELLRIGIRDLLQVASVVETVASLSDLAAAVIQAAYEIVESELQAQHGIPMHRDRRGQWVQTGFVVFGMGKLGGRELNYSSDVDLIYAYASSEGHTRPSAGQVGLSNEAYFQRLAQRLTHALSAATQEGILFRVDLRLRPEGTVGPLAHSFEQAIHYYQTRGREWERLAFLKARPIAGSLGVGRAFLRRLRPFILGAYGDAGQNIVQTIRALKSKIHSNMVRRRETTRNVKLGTGGIREIEFIVQALQLVHGESIPGILERNTLRALHKLVCAQLLDQPTAEELKRAYLFLRNLEHKLQMVYELQTHSLPTDREEVRKCAIRLGYSATPGKDVAGELLADYSRTTEFVQQTFSRFFPEMNGTDRPKRS